MRRHLRSRDSNHKEEQKDVSRNASQAAIGGRVDKKSRHGFKKSIKAERERFLDEQQQQVRRRS